MEQVRFKHAGTPPAAITIHVHVRNRAGPLNLVPVIQTAVSSLTVSVTVHDGGQGRPHTLVKLVGEADVTSRQELASLLETEIRKRPGLLILELSALQYMDSSALQVIIRARHALSDNGGALALVSPHHVVARMLAIGQVDHLIPIYATALEAASR